MQKRKQPFFCNHPWIAAAVLVLNSIRTFTMKLLKWRVGTSRFPLSFRLFAPISLFYMSWYFSRSHTTFFTMGQGDATTWRDGGWGLPVLFGLLGFVSFVACWAPRVPKHLIAKFSRKGERKRQHEQREIVRALR